MSCYRVFSNQGNIVAVGKARNYKGRKNPRLIQRYYFLTIYGQIKPFFKRQQEHCIQRKIILEKYNWIWTFILLDPMDVSFFLNEVLWEFQRPVLIYGSSLFSRGPQPQAMQWQKSVSCGVLPWGWIVVWSLLCLKLQNFLESVRSGHTLQMFSLLGLRSLLRFLYP